MWETATITLFTAFTGSEPSKFLVGIVIKSIFELKVKGHIINLRSTNGTITIYKTFSITLCVSVASTA